MVKKNSTIILQIAIVFVAIGAATFLLWEPHVEGVNTNANSIYEIYFDDPFLAYAYIASIPFFAALYQAFKLLGYIRRNKVFSEAAIKSLQTIKYSAICIIGFVIGGVIILLSGESDDRPPIVMMGLAVTLGSIIVATAATISVKKLTLRG